MTLLMGARGRKHFVAMADGMSFKYTDSTSEVEREDLQKLFALEGAPVVLAHHGENMLGLVPIGKLLTEPDFQAGLRRAWPRGLNIALAETILRLDEIVTQTLESAPVRRACGLWLAGMWPCTDVPDIAEVHWGKSAPFRTRVEVRAFGDLTLSGSGAPLLADYLKKPLDDKFSVEKIFAESVEYSMEFLKKLYAEALAKQKALGKTVFGGQAWMAVITRDGVDLGKV